MRLSRPAPFCLLLCASPLRCRRQAARCTGDKGTIAVDKSCHLPLWKQVPRLHLALTVEANVVRLCISDSRRTQRYEDHLCRLRSINDIFPFGSVTPVRFLDPRKQAVGFGECLEPGATAP